MRSAYHMLFNQSHAVEASSSSSSSRGQIQRGWSSIWAVPVQPKVKLFIWRACEAILPTQTNLFDKGVSQTYPCLWCGDETKTVDHLL